MLGFAGKSGHSLCGNRWKYPQLYPHRGIGMIDQSGCRCQGCALSDKTVVAQTALLAYAWIGTR